MIYEVKHPEVVKHIFEGWRETLIWSCLQNVMGYLYADSKENPVSAMALLGDFCFFSGRPNKELVMYKPEWCKQEFLIMVPQNEAWAEMIEECYKEKAKKVVRYAIKKESDIFDEDMLKNVVNGLPDGYTLKRMDEELFYRCKQIPWCRDWVSQYKDYAMYQRYGLGLSLIHI